MNTQSNEINQNQAYHYDWAEGFKKSLPVAMGYLPAGIAFGVLAQVAGVPVWATIMLSVVLYAGAAQYACLKMLSAGEAISSIASNIAAINLRHVFYAAPLLHAMPSNKIAKIYCLFALTDETFSVMTSLPPESRARLILPILWMGAKQAWAPLAMRTWAAATSMRKYCAALCGKAAMAMPSAACLSRAAAGTAIARSRPAG